MLRQKGLLLFTCLLAFTTNLTLALPPGPAPWTNFVSQPVYSRSLGPPSGMDTISVPYVPKSPLFPKFVDPKTLISKKTDILSNLFGGLGPVAYNIPDTKPIASYSASGPSLSNAGSANMLLDGKEGGGMYKRGMFSPFGPKFGPMGPKFGPAISSSLPETSPEYKTAFFRKKRSIVPSFADDTSSVLNGKTSPSQTIESISAIKSTADDTPKEYSGMFGPFGSSGFFGPSGSFGPMVDPSAFVAKKSAFLDTLFKNLATSTPASAITDVPAPKSTIVPPSFWMPSSIIPSPTEYTSKVSDFLNKLFDSLNLNATAAQGAADGSDAKSDFLRSVKSDDISPNKIARSLYDVSSVATAKDAIVNTILSELGDLKSDMLQTLNDLITYEKTAAAAATSTTKKPFKPFASVFPFAKPTVDPTLPFKQRMDALSQVFDMLTDLQRNITAITKSATTAGPDTAGNDLESPKISSAASDAIGASPINNTLLNAILKKISTIESASPAFYPTYPIKESPIMSRASPKEPTPWMSYSKNLTPAVKRQVDDDLLPYLEYEDRNDQRDHRQYTRGVQMQMHQGYQSLPAGSVESVQAGGGSTPGHQGGGIKLLEPHSYENLDKWANWMQYREKENEDHRHHHNHH